MKLPYAEGSVFLVPLRNSGYGRGVVARSGPNGKALLGYFFGPRIHVPMSATLDDLDPTNAVLKVIFGDLGLINGEWPVIGGVPLWDRAKWPMPDFARRDPLSRKAWLVRRSDTNPGHVVSETPVDYDAMIPTDSISGYGAVEIKLTKAFSS